MSDANGLPGNQSPSAGGSRFNAHAFLIQQMLAKANTSGLVKVVAVSNNDTLDPVGFVDMTPLVNQLDAGGSAIEHGVIYNCCYSRMQGGDNAIILDPKVGDIGVAVYADRDISSVQITKKRSNPGSARRFDMSDGIYLFGVLNGVPAQYIQFVSGTEIKVHSPTKIVIEAPEVDIIGKTTHTGQVWMNGKRVDETHEHGLVTPGTGNSGTVV